MSWTEDVPRALAEVGLNVVGVADGRGHEAVLPGCRSVLVFASGGTALWEAMCADLAAHPTHLSAETHPLDAFVARAITSADPAPPASRRWIRCAAEPEAFVDFRPLARDAGLGYSGRMGLLMHPEHGPWVGLRAACFTTEVLAVDGPLTGEGPCPGCPGHCAQACPGGAFPEGSLDIRKCATFHRRSDRCLGQCEARLACPEGAASRHGALQHRYHYDRRGGRVALAAALGIDDERVGVGPHWGEW